MLLWMIIPYLLMKTACSSETTNIAIIVDEHVTLPCRSDNPTTSPLVHWYYIPVGKTESSKRIIYNGKKFLDEFEDVFVVNKTASGQYDLSTYNARFSDAGTYTCEIFGGKTLPNVELVVLDDTPRCEIVGDRTFLGTSEYIGIKCSVNYTGSWMPHIIWKLNGESGQTDITRNAKTIRVANDITRDGSGVLISKINISGVLTRNHTWASCQIQRYPLTWDDSPVSLKWDCPPIIYTSSINSDILPNTSSNGPSTRTSVIIIVCVVVITVSIVVFIVLFCVLTKYKCAVRNKGADVPQSEEVDTHAGGTYESDSQASEHPYDVIDGVTMQAYISLTNLPRDGSSPNEYSRIFRGNQINELLPASTEHHYVNRNQVATGNE